MKKKLLMLLMVFCMILPTVPAFADEMMEQRVFDYADLLSEEDEREIHLWVQDMQENWGMDLAFLTTDDTDGMSVQEYGAEFYMDHDLGMGSDYDGVIFVLDMGSREGQIITSGKAIDIYTDFYIDKMWDNMVGYLSEGDYYWAFFTLYMDLDHYAEEYQLYLENPDSYVSEYEKETGGNPLLFVGIALVLSLVIALIAVNSLKRSHKNVKPFTDGRAYLKENGYFLTTNLDSFVSTHTSMMPIPKDDDHKNSWGGGSSTFSSGGRSFGGGGGKF